MKLQLDPNMAASMAAQNGAPAAPAKDPYAGYLRWGFITIAALVLGMFGWAMMAKINGAVMATGLVQVQGKPAMIQHLDGGIIGEILVEDGQSVEAGEVLMRLDPTLLDVNREIVDVQLNETLARVTRLLAERDNLSEITWPPQLLCNRAKRIPIRFIAQNRQIQIRGPTRMKHRAQRRRLGLRHRSFPDRRGRLGL